MSCRVAGGVPLQIEMMTKSLIESNLLFLDASSRAYELEGSLESHAGVPQTRILLCTLLGSGVLRANILRV